MPFRIIRNDITKVKTDAIVNMANPDVAEGDGVDVCIKDAFDLDAKYIIHVCGPVWENGDNNEKNILRDCYDKALILAKEHNCKSIAFPLVSTGTYGFPKELGVQIAVEAFTSFLENHEIDITLVVFESDSVKVSGKLVDEVSSYIDDGYVESVFAEEYIHDGYPVSQSFGDAVDNRSTKRHGLFRRNKKTVEDARKSEKTFGCAPSIHAGALAEGVYDEAAKQPRQKEESLEDVLKGIYTDSFEKHLQQLINKKGLKNSEVYAAANISKQYFSKLLKGQVKPSKEKMLALAVGLRLNLDETIDFLKIAGYALSPISQTDAVVAYFIEHRDYNVIKIDIVLFDYGLDPLSKV